MTRVLLVDPALATMAPRFRAVLPADVAVADLYFASERAAKTTGGMLPVDGGLREAFPR